MEYLTYKRFNFLKWFTPFAVFIASLLAEYSYVYYKTGEFKETPFVVTYVAAPLFIAKYDNIERLKNQKQKDFLKAALEERDKYQVGLFDPFRKDYEFYFPIHMRFEIVHDFYRYHATGIALKKAGIPIHEHDSLVKNISFELINLNIIDYISLYINMFIHALGGYYPLAILGLLFLMSTFCFIRFKQEILLFASLATFLQFLNYGIVALMQPILRRYVFYTDTFYLISFVLVMTLLYRFMKRESL